MANDDVCCDAPRVLVACEARVRRSELFALRSYLARCLQHSWACRAANGVRRLVCSCFKKLASGVFMLQKAGAHM